MVELGLDTPLFVLNQNSCDFSFICVTDGRKCTVTQRASN